MPAASHPFLPLIMETLTATEARQIIRIGDLAWPDIATSSEAMSVSAALSSAMQRSRVDLAVACLEPGENERHARQLIAVMRDLLARQLLVFVPEKLLDDTSLIGLGLNRQARFETDDVHWQAWSYDIRTYKSVPDWLNPRFWANPENWNKFRW